MLSTGTRIGSSRIIDPLIEGSCGQSYHCIGFEGESKGCELYVKLISREISEEKGFQDYFLQEIKAIEQLEGTGIWPITNFGVSKWKHWVNYSWISGVVLEHAEDDEAKKNIRNLADLCLLKPEEVTKKQLLSIMISIHCGLNKAHVAGVCHGNLKPSNILVKKNDDGNWEGIISELGLYRITLFNPKIVDELVVKDKFESGERLSLDESFKFRPPGVSRTQIPEENWDLFALGKILFWIIGHVQKNNNSDSYWHDWLEWGERATSINTHKTFQTCAHSMEALPNIGEISRFGIKADDLGDSKFVDNEELRLKREAKFELDQKVNSLKTKRGITGLIGGLLLVFFMLYSLYLFWSPTPWTEYSSGGSSDSYQMGIGFLSGQAWGIVPGIYDEDGLGGQDVVGEWTKEAGLFKLKFKRFKKSLEKKSGKKLWQFIGKGGTSEEDYFIWTDYLGYNRKQDSLNLIKRVDKNHTYIPATSGDGKVSLYPKERIKFSNAKIEKSELKFFSQRKSKKRWFLFFAVGFCLASFLYHRELMKLQILNAGND